MVNKRYKKWGIACNVFQFNMLNRKMFNQICERLNFSKMERLMNQWDIALSHFVCTEFKEPPQNWNPQSNNPTLLQNPPNRITTYLYRYCYRLVSYSLVEILYLLLKLYFRPLRLMSLSGWFGRSLVKVVKNVTPV